MADSTKHHGMFSSSPISTDAHSSSPHRTHLSISTQLSPKSIQTYPDTLKFPKCAIQSSNPSTDTEASSDYGVDLFPGHARRAQVVSPSPSLLTHMLHHNQCHSTAQAHAHAMSSAATSRSSSTSQPTPLTPTMSACGKPILRRDTSAPTSASEDNGLGLKGLGMALTSCVGQQQAGEQPKRACSLKFAVRSPPSSTQPLSDSGYSNAISSESAKKSRFRPTKGFYPGHDDEDAGSSVGHHSHHHLAATLEQDEDEDEDEGYQEDSEGGFTSEEEDDYFTAPTRGRRSFQQWTQNTSFAPYSPGPRRRVTHSADQAVIYTSTNEDCPPPPVTRGPGRKVSIADVRMKFDHCSRHLSPPPRELGLSPELEIAPAPPPASSPSARDLCRRRESSCNTSTTSAGPSRRGAVDTRPRVVKTAQSDDAQAQGSARCRSILKRECSNDRRPMSPVLTFAGERRSSEPPQCRVETRCASGAVSPVGSEAERETATQGLQRCLAKC